MSTSVALSKFNKLIPRLKDQEFDALFTTMRVQFGRQYMMELLTSSLPLSQTKDSIDKIVSIAATIIRQRKPPKRRFVDLPKSLIGEIASYLKQKSFVRFARTNHKIFADCHSPNALTNLDLIGLTDYSLIPLGNYPNLRRLKFRLPQMDTFQSDVMNVHCPRLETLCIYVDGVGSRNITDGHSFGVYLERFIVRNVGGFRNVTTLCIRKRAPTMMVTTNRLIRLFSLFPNLVHLRLHCSMRCSIPKSLTTLCPSIQQLFVRGLRDDISLLRSFRTMLDTLTWNLRSSDSMDLLSDTSDSSTDWLSWSKLRRLCLMAPTQNVMDHFLENANSLKQICFVPNTRSPKWKQHMNAQQIGMTTKRLFTDYPLLEFIYISTRGHFERICHSIHCGLYRIRKSKRKYLEIALHLDCSEIDALADFMCNISKILMVLSGAKIKQWMLSLVRNKRYDLKPMAKAIRELISSYPGLNMKLSRRLWTQLTVTNKKCKALCHDHWWNDCVKTDFY